MKLVTDLERIKQLGRRREHENFDFRTFLKSHDMSDADLDALVHRINDEVTALIDCTECANCCVALRPALSDKDISEFAAGLNQPEADFRDNYIRLNSSEADSYEFNALPCPFLQDNLCTNYDHRPQDCRSFPHLHKERFRSRLFMVIDTYEICPIPFNVYERLKIEFEWRGRRKRRRS
jgi:Fe-S-cluster containining protein